MTLQSGALLQEGKYRIVRVLGQGGFGITYLAEQVALGRQVAIKEFFMKEMCGRDAETSHVTLGTGARRETVQRFREKFLKEARNIASLDHPGIVRIYDVFEENGTAYYVMEYLRGGSLKAMTDKHPLSEVVAVEMVRHVADALAYIHSRHMLHLDVKPSNILLRKVGEQPVLIDFGISKHYDTQGEQTTTMQAGISKGYAPMEQYSQEMQTFTPSTDIYSLGATLYSLLTGQTPPEASLVNEEGIPPLAGVSLPSCCLIKHCMQPRRQDRPQSVAAFLQLLDAPGEAQDEETVLVEPKPVKIKLVKSKLAKFKSIIPKPKFPHLPRRRLLWPALCAVVGMVVCLLLWKLWPVTSTDVASIEQPTTNVVSPSAFLPSVLQQLERDMVFVEGGTFTMGATAEQGSEAFDNEKPTHTVTLSSFYICKHEVTQAEWVSVMGNNPSGFKGANRPVEDVSWDDCQEFIRKLNKLTGKQYCLPTEAEWEYAARGGKKSLDYKYSGGNTIENVAWYTDNSCSETHAVMTKQANELGLYDMSGNVWEWCCDWYGDYSSLSQTNPKGTSSGSRRVIRGGGWYGSARNCCVSRRDRVTPDGWDDDLGLRLALPCAAQHEKSAPITDVTLGEQLASNAVPPFASLPPVLHQLEKNMVFVEGGTFSMGATVEQGSDADDNEKPTHQVTLSSFRICKHEVTQAEWEAVMGSNPSEFKGANRPVECVSWDDCQIFIRKLNALTGKTYRLPTEAEWEYAARGGNRSQSYKYSGSNTLSSVAWYRENCYDKGKNAPDYGTHAEMTKQANELGLYDMSGNVWEWCSDWYGDYSSLSQINPKGSSSDSRRVLRGGGWFNSSRLCRVSYRHGITPDDRDDGVGLRLACSILP